MVSRMGDINVDVMCNDSKGFEIKEQENSYGLANFELVHRLKLH